MSDRQTYQVQTRHVEALLTVPSIAFQVPVFQRRYAWDTEQVDDLIHDLYGGDLWWTQQGDGEPYFLGSIVYSRAEGPLSLLDGQQRLTTITLLIAALSQALEQENYPTKRPLENYLFAKKFGEASRPKITLQPNDVNLYERLLGDPRCAEGETDRRSALARSTQRISMGIREFLEIGRQRKISPIDVLERMVKRLLYGVEFVCIEAASEASAFRLFETLNDRGLPLNGADLIKNKLFAQAGPHLEEARLSWDRIVENVRDEILNYLRYYWVAFEGPVSKDRLYKEYGSRIQQFRSEQALEFSSRIERASELYGHLAQPSRKTCPWGDATSDTLERLAEMRARSCRPLLLFCAKNHPTHLEEVAKLCESASVRHTLVWGKNPNQLERAYENICRLLRTGEQDVVTIVHRELNRCMPSNDEFRSAFCQLEVANITGAWRTLLTRLNEVSSSGETRVEGPAKVHVEHVFPKTPSKEARLESNVDAKDVDSLAYRIGNLTLLSGRKNQSISNLPFSKKRATLESSEIILNRSIAACKQWTRSEVDARSIALSLVALDAWPWPGGELPRVAAIESTSSDGSPLIQSRIMSVSAVDSDEGALKTKTEPVDREVTQRRFWTELLDLANNRTSLHSGITPGTANWAATATGVPGLNWSYYLRRHDAQVELYIDQDKNTGEGNQQILDKIRQQQGQIEKEFGGALLWEALDEKRACRIRHVVTLGGREDENRWPEIQAALVDAMVRLEKAIGPHLLQLRSDAVGDLEARPPATRDYWLNKSSPVTVDLVEKLLGLINEKAASKQQLTFNRYFIGLNDGNRSGNFAEFTPGKHAVRLKLRVSNGAGWTDRLKNAGIEAAVRDKDKGVKFSIAPEVLERHRDVIAELVHCAVTEHQERR